MIAAFNAPNGQANSKFQKIVNTMINPSLTLI